MNMGLKKLRERVKKQQEKVGNKVTMSILNYSITKKPQEKIKNTYYSGPQLSLIYT